MIKQIFIVAVLFICSYSFAQEGSVSPYSFYGTGDQRFKGTAENRSMGGISVYTDSIHLNVMNPASLGKLRLTTFSVAGSYNSSSLKTVDASESASDVTFDYLVLGIPLGNNMGMSFGLIPYTSVGYKVQSIDETASPAKSSLYDGEGGLNKAHLAFGYNFLKNFSIGAKANFNFGKVTNTAVYQYEGIQYGSRIRNESEYSGFDFNFSLNYGAELTDALSLKSLIGYTPATKITSSNSRIVTTVPASVNGFYEVDLAKYGLNSTYLHLPESYTVGLGVGKKYTWFIGGEFEYINSSEFKNDFVNPVNGAYEDGERFSAGAFWTPDYDSFTSYWKRITYRIGVRNEKTGLLVNNVPVHDFGMSFGLGLPMNGFSNANVGVEFGKKGSTYLGRVEENYFNVFISLSLNDRWFRPNYIR
ncbi:hypothetical protein [Galbibacter pacificus]|uniref:Long-chain fatty acid transport protein n=1 Tax=Galbibacter pacificus TaxID=2996052 RepID=A0ABT6FWQ0_9FLAO|nr:hypothetical protein [Galbibacter pacificus]MDG3584053.1 hypothetical protein [Galbibacter pacificus]MDG3587511.1 hypothetical protein [Galbibacter pacificus]